MVLTSGWGLKIGSTIAAVISLFQLYAVIFGFPPVMLHRTIFLELIFIVAIFKYPGENNKLDLWAILLISLTIAVGAYFLISFELLNSRIAYVDSVSNVDICFGLACLLVLFETTRRTCGTGLPIIMLVFLLYAFIGPHLPGLLAHPGISLEDLIDLQFLTPGGIFGVATGAVVSFVFFFMLFGACLEKSGASKTFLETALILTSNRVGGVAKCSVIGSALMGMTSGSAVGNTVSTGAITIPMMKKGGYPSVTAGAIEAISSTGGQLMPPIMGVSAFIMAEIVGVPYKTIAIGACLPAMLYYAGIYFVVHQYGIKLNIKGSKQEKNIWTVLRTDGYLFAPILALLYFIGIGNTLMMAALKASALVLILSMFKKENRIGFKKLYEILVETGARTCVVAIPCAAAGFITGVITQSGLAAKMTNLFILLGGGNLLLTLIFTLVPCVILGMGMPTVTAYIMVAITMAPVLINLGATPIAAHLFVFYIALMAMVTPPVALAAYAAAGISGASSNKTGWTALILGFSGFATPFLVVFYPPLTTIVAGSIMASIVAMAKAMAVIFLLSGVITGYYRHKAHIIERVFCFFTAAVIAVSLNSISISLAGLAMFIGMMVYHYNFKKTIIQPVKINSNAS